MLKLYAKPFAAVDAISNIVNTLGRLPEIVFCAEHEAQQRTGGLGIWQGGLIAGTNQRKSPFGGPRKAYSHDTTTAPLLQETPARGDAAKFWEGLNKSLVFRPSLGWKTDGATKTDERQVSSPASKNTPYVCHRTDRARFVG